MVDETTSLFPFHKTEAVVSGVFVSIVFLVGLITLVPLLLSFSAPPCDGIFFLMAPIIAFISFLFTLFWASIGLIRFVGKTAFIVTGDCLNRTTHLAFLLPLLTILAVLGGWAGFISVGLIAIFLLVAPYLIDRSSFKTNAIVVAGNIVLSLVTFSLSIILLLSAMGMCYISRF